MLTKIKVFAYMQWKVSKKQVPVVTEGEGGDRRAGPESQFDYSWSHDNPLPQSCWIYYDAEIHILWFLIYIEFYWMYTCSFCRFTISECTIQINLILLSSVYFIYQMGEEFLRV